MSIPIDKKEYYRMRYTRGTVIELTEPLEDSYSSKPAGAKIKVDFVDDALQLQGHWLPPESGTLAVAIEKDKFKIIR